jgi:hypothetical protein
VKIKKTVTAAKLAANRRNAKHSTGPKTAAGKKRSKMSAVTHSLFAQKLVLNDEDSRRLETLCRSLHADLAPNTTLQEVQFELIVAWMGRCSLALAVDMRYINRLLGQDGEHRSQSDLPPGHVEWYLSGKQGLREGMRLLETVEREFLILGRIDEARHDQLDKAFGPQFRHELSQWTPSNPDAAMAADQIVMHARTYNMDIPRLDGNPESSNEPKVILDPNQSKQMVVKLLEMQRFVLSNLLSSVEQRNSSSAREQSGALDPPRHYSAACRDLHHAIEKYWYLKKNKL